MLVQEIMTKKVELIDSYEPVIEACKRYRDLKLGSLIVTKKDIIVGIITERDIIEKIIINEKNPKTTQVKEVMTPNLKTINSTSTLEDAVKIMKENKIKKLPVVYNNKVVGIITENDIVRAIELIKSK